MRASGGEACLGVVPASCSFFAPHCAKTKNSVILSIQQGGRPSLFFLAKIAQAIVHPPKAFVFLRGNMYDLVLLAHHAIRALLAPTARDEIAGYGTRALFLLKQRISIRVHHK